MSESNSLSSHVLDTASGKPADGLPLVLKQHTPTGLIVITEKTTNEDGRVGKTEFGTLSTGTYTIRFETSTYFAMKGIEGYLYPYVDVTFIVNADGGHYHIPLLLSPYGYSTYRGS